MKAAVNEPGLFIGAIRKELGVGKYKGNESLTEKKILRNVFKVNSSYLSRALVTAVLHRGTPNKPVRKPDMLNASAKPIT